MIRHSLLRRILEAEEYSLDQFMSVDGRSNTTKFDPDTADPEELAMGVQVEFEHTTMAEVSRKIALDHLAENKDSRYYSALKEMERLVKILSPMSREKQDECLTGLKEFVDACGGVGLLWEKD